MIRGGFDSLGGSWVLKGFLVGEIGFDDSDGLVFIRSTFHS